jgi:hypothetical protein
MSEAGATDYHLVGWAERADRRSAVDRGLMSPIQVAAGLHAHPMMRAVQMMRAVRSSQTD